MRHKCINDIVIIDGLTRSGKFYLGKIISGIQGLEYFINSSETERILAISKAGLLSKNNASSLLVLAINESIYNLAIGRNLNSRYDDGSSIINSFERKLYTERERKDVVGPAAINELKKNKRASVFVLHQSLQLIDIVKQALPKSKIINIRRHPIDLVYSWIKRGWGSRYGNDPLVFEPVYNCSNGVVPYFATKWCDDYLISNECDRVIKSILYLSNHESRVIDNSKYDICSIYYDNLVSQPNDEVNKICEFLDRTKHSSMKKIIAKETRDTDLDINRAKKLKFLQNKSKEKGAISKLIDLATIYEQKVKED